MPVRPHTRTRTSTNFIINNAKVMFGAITETLFLLALAIAVATCPLGGAAAHSALTASVASEPQPAGCAGSTGDPCRVREAAALGHANTCQVASSD